MPEVSGVQLGQAVDSGVAEAPTGTTARVQFMRRLAALSYEEQIAAVSPGGMLQAPRPAAPLREAPVQQAVETVQMEAEGAAPAAGAGPAPSGPPSPATLEQRLRDLMGVGTPAIEAASDDPVITIGADGRSLEGFRSDSLDPLNLKAEIIRLTSQYLALPEDADPAMRQNRLEAIRAAFELLRTAMKHARGEEDKLVALRVKFEKYLGTKAEGEWPQGVTCVNNMVSTAQAMIVQQEGGVVASARAIDAQLAALPADVKAAIGSKIGTDINMGFAGVVGKSFAAIMTALSEGSLVQKAQGLIGFTDGYLIPKLMEGASQVFSIAQANLAEAAPTIELQQLIEQARGKTPKEQKTILLTNAEFRAKLGNMDTKIMQVPVELLNDRQLDFVAQQATPAVDLTGCTTPEQKIARLKAAGIHTSKAAGGAVDATSIAAAEVEEQVAFEQAMEGITVQNKSYIEGKLENIVNPTHPWIINANEAQMPLKAGISGTTARFVGAANLLGGDKNGAVVAMLGHLQAIEAHSFWEIVDAAGIGMTAGKYVPFPPNDGGMIGAGTQFLNNPENGFADLGDGDKAKARKVLLGET